MMTASQQLAEFAAALEFARIPADVVARAKVSLTDSVAVASYGAAFPWSCAVADYARRYGSGGRCTVVGVPRLRVHAPCAALANGVHAHAFEQDSVGVPGAHPGATLFPAVLAACEESGADGKTAITAFVAGCEAMFRIAGASHHSPEQLGFHAPGLIGTYGAAVAAARVFGLDAHRTAHALGIAGSLSSGLLAFTRSAHGAMVKRLHLGRASEAGILAARLAADGFTGPETVLEGRFGFLDVYCRDGDAAQLVAGLGRTWETLKILTKRYACHLFAQMPMWGLRELMASHGFGGGEVERIVVTGSERLLTHHGNRAPADIGQAQYSVPFCLALSLYRDPDDPASFDAGAIADCAIRDACRDLIELRTRPQAGHPVRSAHLRVRLRSGREFERECDSFRGMPDDPLTPDELRRKFLLLSPGMDPVKAEALFARMQSLEAQACFSVASTD